LIIKCMDHLEETNIHLLEDNLEDNLEEINTHHNKWEEEECNILNNQ